MICWIGLSKGIEHLSSFLNDQQPTILKPITLPISLNFFFFCLEMYDKLASTQVRASNLHFHTLATASLATLAINNLGKLNMENVVYPKPLYVFFSSSRYNSVTGKQNFSAIKKKLIISSALFILPPAQNFPVTNSSTPNCSKPTPTKPTPALLRLGANVLSSFAPSRQSTHPKRRMKKTTQVRCSHSELNATF